METGLKLYPIIIRLYTELYTQAAVRSKRHEFSPNPREKKLIIKFIGWLKSAYDKNQIGIDFLIIYFEFQFNRYIGIRTPSGGLNDVRITWLIGPKAIGVWQQRNPAKKKFIKYRISKNVKLQLSKTFAAEKKVKVNTLHNNMLTSVQKSEELEKERYFDSEVGYLHCADMTTLYNPVSNFCSRCKFAGECKQRLKNNFPKIFEVRNL